MAKRDYEKYGGAGAVGFTFFDIFIKILDTYGRWDALVNIHEHIPKFLTNPTLVLASLLLGLYLLNRSHQKQFSQISKGATLVDTSGIALSSSNKVGWLRPMLMMIPMVFLMALALNLYLVLASNGPNPPRPKGIVPPMIAYEKSRTTPKTVRVMEPRVVQHSEGANSPNVVGSNNQFSYNAEPFPRAFSDAQAEKIIRNLQPYSAPFWLIIETPFHQSPGREMNDEQGIFANQLASVLTAAGWKDKEDECDKSHVPCPQPNPGFKYDDVSDHGIVIMTPIALENSARKLQEELNRLMFKNILQIVDRYQQGRPLDVVIIKVGMS
jgi:hypothetical protein